jgi:hypothetical protein
MQTKPTQCAHHTQNGGEKNSTFCWLPIQSPPILINISILISKFVSFKPMGERRAIAQSPKYFTIPTQKGRR